MKGFFRLWAPQCICLLITLHLFPHIFADDSSCLPCFMLPLCPLTCYPQETVTASTFFILKMLKSILQPAGLIHVCICHLWKRINCYVADNSPCVMGRDHVTPRKWIHAQQEAGDSHRQGAEMSPDSCSPKHRAWHGAQSSWTGPQ